MSEQDLREFITSRSAFQSMLRGCAAFEVDKVISRRNIKVQSPPEQMNIDKTGYN